MTERPQVTSSRYKVPNLERGLQILELLLDHPNGLQQSEIAAILHCPKSSVFRISLTFIGQGYMMRDPETKAVRLTRKLVAMGSRVMAEEDLLTVSVDVLKSLRDHLCETVLIGTNVETELVVLGQALGSYPFKFSIDLGARLPLHTAAPGKAILAFLPEDEQQAIVKRLSFERYTRTTITDAPTFLQELERARSLGYAVDRGEQLTGIHCVAAPVLNRSGYPIASIWTTGPTDRLREADLAGAGVLVMAHADTISRRLGHGLLSGNGKGSNRNLQHAIA